MNLRKNAYLSIAAVVGVLFAVGCSNSSGGMDAADSEAPTVTNVYPANLADNAGTAGTVSATFSEAMDSTTIIGANFTLSSTSGIEDGTVSYDLGNHRAMFAPSALLAPATEYTATVTTEAKDLAGMAISVDKVWTFTTAALGAGPAPVLLRSAGNFAILAKSGISTVPASVITGNIGLSPAAESVMTGFSQTKANGYSTSPQVTGFMYAADMTPPTPTMMTTACSNMETAYNDAVGRTSPNYSDLATGALGGRTLTPGLYKWNSSVTIDSDLTISGGANDVWIFQITGDLALGNASEIILIGGAQAKNIFWQVAGLATMGTTSHFEGIVLSMTSITLNTGATMNGRIMAQTNVALDQATVTQPVE